MMRWFYKRCAAAITFDAAKRLDERIKELELRLEAYKAETHDLIYPTLRKINQREGVRQRREEEKDGEQAVPLNNPMFKV